VSFKVQLPITCDTKKGTRPYQEDRVFIAGYEQGWLLGVFDGHGGHHTSQALCEELPSVFADEIGEPKATAKKALANSIKKVADLTKDYANGSTLSLVWIPTKGNTVTCAVIGDSPILIKDAEGKIHIGPDHNVRTNRKEAEAAEMRGGIVYGGYLYDGSNQYGSQLRGPGLQMARALGDVALARVLLREPEIYTVKVNAESFVIVATDGVFDPGHEETHTAIEAVVTLVAGGGDAEAVVARAVELKTGDNASAIVARFEPKAKKKKKTKEA